MSLLRNLLLLSAVGAGAYFIITSTDLFASVSQPETKGGKSLKEQASRFLSAEQYPGSVSRPQIRLNIPDKLKKFKSYVDKHSKQYNIDPALVYSIIMVESSGRPDVKYKENGHYSRGLMQIVPKTAQAMGYSGDIEGLFDPETNIKFGVKYLSRLSTYRKIGDDVQRIAAGYNAGPDITPWPKNYMDKVTTWYNRIKE